MVTTGKDGALTGGPDFMRACYLEADINMAAGLGCCHVDQATGRAARAAHLSVVPNVILHGSPRNAPSVLARGQGVWRQVGSGSLNLLHEGMLFLKLRGRNRIIQGTACAPEEISKQRWLCRRWATTWWTASWATTSPS